MDIGRADECKVGVGARILVVDDHDKYDIRTRSRLLFLSYTSIYMALAMCRSEQLLSCRCFCQKRNPTVLKRFARSRVIEDFSHIPNL
jgi:hypothetical protein